ncbi:MAG TPA: hypothetical protein VGR28_00225 [Candidatus Thermoplasmatota archaeon]|jgi:hypothetical protein|nr:hypothetical protein [Candidatus Thermoplasmatota archaeon]
MSRRWALAALLLLAPWPGPADASPPLQQPWSVALGSASTPAGAALALGFDEAGNNAVVGTADLAGPAPGPVGSPTPDADFALVDFNSGNLTVDADDQTTKLGEGKAAVAISGDGKSAVAGGAYPGDTLNGTNVFFYALPDTNPIWTKSKPEPVSAVAVSHDGRVVAVGTRNTTTSLGRVARFAGQGDVNAPGTQLWETTANRCGDTTGSGGSVNALDLSRDGRWLAVATLVQTSEGPRGCALLFDASNAGGAAPVQARLLPAEGVAADINADGTWFAVGTAGGHFFLFGNIADAPASEGSQLNSQQPVVGLKVSRDGGAVVVADAASVSRYVYRAGTPQLDWSAPVASVRSLDATSEGDYIVVGGSVLQAFHRSANQTLWTVDFANALVRIAEGGASDVRIVAASGPDVRGWKLHWAFEVRKTEAEPIQLQPDVPRQVPLTIVNTGSAADTFDLSVQAAGFQVGLDPGNLSLLPGQEGTVTLTLVPEPGAQAGLYRLDVPIRGARSGATSSATLNVTLGAVPRMSIALLDGGDRDRIVLQGDQVNVLLAVRNSGNARLEVGYDLQQTPNVGEPWEAQLSQTSSVLGAGDVSTNTLSVVVPPDAPNGTENVFNILARSEGVQSNVTVRMVVNPTFTASIEVSPPSKIVNPGKSVAYTVVVTNNGTLREEYRLAYCLARVREDNPFIPCVGNATAGLGGWAVALDTSAFFLDHNQSRSFHMTIAAPRGALPRVDKLALQVEVVNVNPLHPLRDVKLVITSVEEEVPAPPPPKPVPGFEPLAVLAGLALAFAAFRRQR